jgi:preprotein translocase subunit SecG
LVIEYALLLAALSGLFYFMFGNTFQAQFSLIDDHHFLHWALEETSFWDVAFRVDIQFGRFRPVYYFHRFAKFALFGTDPGAWYITTTSFGVLTCFLFYITVRKIGADILSSLLFFLLFTVTGHQSFIWYKLSTGETESMLLTSISVWAIANAAYQGKSRFWDSLALVAMALAGLSKESFVLIIPALLLLRWTLQCWFNKETWQKALHTLRTPLVVGSLIFIVEILVIVAVLLSKSEAFGPSAVGLSLKSFDPRGWYNLLTSSQLAVVARYLPLLGALILAIYWPQKLARPYMFASLFIFIAWVIPQLMLYRRGIDYHYLFPAIVGIAGVNAFGLAALWSRRIWVLWTACVIWLLPSLSNGIDTTIQVASFYTADTLAVHEMVTYLAENVESSRSIVIAADPAYYYEPIYSLATHLKFAGSKSTVYLLPIFPEGGYKDKPFHHGLNPQQLAENIISHHPDLATLDPNYIGGIIALTLPADSSDMPSWFISSQWQEKIFNEPYYRFSLQKLGYVKTGDIRYRILTPASEALSAVPPDYPLITIGPSLKGKVGIDWLTNKNCSKRATTISKRRYPPHAGLVAPGNGVVSTCYQPSRTG